MDWNNPILYSALFALHFMFEHHHLRQRTPPIEETKREFTPMIISLGQSNETSPSMPSHMFNAYQMLLSVYSILSTLQLDFDGEVLDTNVMQDDLAKDKGI